ncbi:MAG TPA: PASTA domain-containing protein [Gemmatimonadales bacterium]|nr:PASTA domain-containing protein [Gemmatimonadales bacterium]
MRLRRHLPPLAERRWSWKGMPALKLSRPTAVRWAGYLVAAVCAGYLTAYLFLFPAPILHAHEAVPRLIGLSMPDASKQLQQAGMHARDGGSEPDAIAPQGTVIWQDPPPGVRAPVGLRVTLVASDGPPKIPVPDLAGLDATLSQRLITAAGLGAAPVESVQAAAPEGVVMVTRPPAGALLAPGTPVTVVVSRGAPTIPVPDVLGMSQTDARTRVESLGLQLGTVSRRHVASANPGTVIAQAPAAGTLAAPGTVVDIVVARSP